MIQSSAVVARCLTATALAVHVVLGCCGHQGATPDPVHPDLPGDHPTHGGTCHEGPCVSLLGVRTVVEFPAPSALPATFCPSGAAPRLAATTAGPEDVAVWHDLPPPVRPHLAKLVLLI
jgi:hypothetical protein